MLRIYFKTYNQRSLSNSGLIQQISRKVSTMNKDFVVVKNLVKFTVTYEIMKVVPEGEDPYDSNTSEYQKFMGYEILSAKQVPKDYNLHEEATKLGYS